MKDIKPAAHQTATFQDMLAERKQLIDDNIKQYAKDTRRTTAQNFTAYSAIATDAYLSILERGGKRLRGVLTMIGYEMLGGKDRAMILEAARAIEMIHAYILIIDDIQDRSPTRRGGPTAHKMLADYHRANRLADGPEHFGMAIALNAALFGSHAAQMTLANLHANEDYRLKVLSIMNRTMIVTAHGQTNDIFNEVVSEVDEQQVDRVLEWKTAYYTFLNPLHVGMVLAGADCADTDAITDYAKHAGRAFQITDDILGTFGTEQTSGKSPEDDIKEGKRTLLTVHALQTASKADKNFLIQMLGNHGLTPAEFARCKEILTESGSVQYAQDQAAEHVREAVHSLKHAVKHWQPEQVRFLRDTVEYLLTRTT